MCKRNKLSAYLDECPNFSTVVRNWNNCPGSVRCGLGREEGEGDRERERERGGGGGGGTLR